MNDITKILLKTNFIDEYSEKLVKKWLKSGLIDEDLSKLDKAILANNLEEAAQELLNRTDEPNNEREKKAGLFLPIIVRLFLEKKLKVIDDMTAFYNAFSEFYNVNWDKYTTTGYYGMDSEAEFCCDYVDQFKTDEGYTI